MNLKTMYKGEISKSGTPILPSKRARKIPEKIQVSKEDLAGINSYSAKPDVDVDPERRGEWRMMKLKLSLDQSL